jgi:hypothetical protein
MRWHIIRTLVYKEALRHLANRGGIALAVLLLVLALLLSASGRSAAVQSGLGFIRGVHHCYVDYWEDGPWIDFLKSHVPESLAGHIHFRNVSRELATLGEREISYPNGTGGIQLRPAPGPNQKPKIWCWYPGEDRSVMAPFESWFWRTTRLYQREQLRQAGLGLPPIEPDDTWIWRESQERFQEEVSAVKAKLPPDKAAQIDVPIYDFERSALRSQPVGTRTTLSSALVLFALFFVCVYLLPSLTCEEREKGVLLAQALSPASPLEILAAKLLFYPTVAVIFAAILGGLASPPVLARPIFWPAIVVLALGSMGIGMTIACLAKTQRAASMTALCYMLVVSMVLLICQQNNISFLPQLWIEYHGPRILSAAIGNSVESIHYLELLGALVLAIGWNAVATVTFRRYGWQ